MGLIWALLELMVVATVLVFTLIWKVLVAVFQFLTELIHGFRVAKDPAADRSASQGIAGLIMAAVIGLLALVGSVTGGGSKADDPSGRVASTSTDASELTFVAPDEVWASGSATSVRVRLTGTVASMHMIRIDDDGDFLDYVAHSQGGRWTRTVRIFACDRGKTRRRARLEATDEDGSGHESADVTVRCAKPKTKLAGNSAPSKAKPVTSKASTDCNANYSGCLKPSSGDYDCSGGSGDGPNYTGTVQVLGVDEYDLDRDGNGTGCD
jgi:hypothetical protein